MSNDYEDDSGCLIVLFLSVVAFMVAGGIYASSTNDYIHSSITTVDLFLSYGSPGNGSAVIV